MKLRSGKNVPFFGKNIPKRTKVCSKSTEHATQKITVPPPVFPGGFGHEDTEKRLENQMVINKARRISRRALDFGFETKSYSPIKRNFVPEQDVTQNLPIFQSTMIDLNDSESDSSSIRYSFCTKKIPKGGVIPENGEFGQTRSFEEELGLSALNDSDLEKISESENYHSETSNLDLTP